MQHQAAPDGQWFKARTSRSSALSLVAAPTFAVMALLTAVADGSAPAMLCASAHGASALTGMVPMYALMSAFHARPWLRLFQGRRRGMVSLSPQPVSRGYSAPPIP